MTDDVMADIAVTEPVAAGPAPPVANEESSLPEAVEAKPAESAIPVDTEPAPESGEEEK